MEKEVIIERDKRASIFLVLFFFITTFNRSRRYAVIFSEKSDKQK